MIFQWGYQKELKIIISIIKGVLSLVVIFKYFMKTKNPVVYQLVLKKKTHSSPETKLEGLMALWMWTL